METLADFGTVSYFAVEVFTIGIFKAWFSMGDVVAAAQLSSGLLALSWRSCWRWSVRAAGARRITASRRASPCRRTA